MRRLLSTTRARGTALAAVGVGAGVGAATYYFMSKGGLSQPLQPLTVDAPPSTSTSPAAAAEPVALRPLASDADLAALITGRSVLLMNRGQSPQNQRAAVEAFRAAAASLPAEVRSQAVFWVIDDASAGKQADALTTRIGVTHDLPFVLFLDRYLDTEHKYLTMDADIPTPASIAGLVQRVIAGTERPAMLGQPRPRGDRSESCRDIYEVVTDSFDDLVLDPRVDVLVEGYTPKCDACKAFAPRYRMFAHLVATHVNKATAAGGGSETLRVACFNILDNDRPTDHMPEKWTPSLRLFKAAPGSSSSSSGGKRAGKSPQPKRKASVLLDYDLLVETLSAPMPPSAPVPPSTATAAPDAATVAATVGAENSSTDGSSASSASGSGGTYTIAAAAAAVDAAAPSAEADGGAATASSSGGSSGNPPKSIVLPTIPELLRFVAAHAGHAIPLTDALLREAALLEEEAVIIERGYTQAQEYMELWAAYKDACSGASASGPTPEEEACAVRLQQAIMHAYKFIIGEATVGSAEEVVARLSKVHDIVQQGGVVQRIEAAFAPPAASGAVAAASAVATAPPAAAPPAAAPMQ